MKNKLEEKLLAMIAPLQQHLSEGKTSLYLGGYAAGYGMRIAGMEGELRLLWGLTPYWAAGGREAEEWKDIFLTSVRNGSNPNHAEYWGSIGEVDQKVVELAALSLNFIWTPDIIWNRLTKEEQDNLAKWLYQVNYHRVPDNNWNFFVVLVNIALMKRHMPYSQEKIDAGIARYESFYLGDGWYGDGQRPQKDYYVSFAIHYYSLLYSVFMEKEDPERCKIYKERAKTFAETFVYWFDNSGRALPYGRSQTYRFAQAAFWSAYAFALGEDCPHAGRVRGMITRHMDRWLEQPIFDNGGMLTVGYYYPNLNMSEGYNSPGSPYWAFKTFLCLGIPEESSFWKEEDDSFPQLEATKLVPQCNMLFQHFGNETVALQTGQYPTVVQTHSAAKYSKFAYSSVFGFSVSRSSESVEECAPDSMLAFALHDKLYVRKKCISFTLKEDELISVWSPVEGITVETRLRPKGRGHVRYHRVTTETECKAYDCGFAYPFTPGMKLETEGSTARAADKNGYSLVRGILPASAKASSVNADAIMANPITAAGKIISAVPNTNLVFPLTRIPALELTLAPGVHEWETYCEAAMNRGKLLVGRGECYELQAE